MEAVPSVSKTHTLFQPEVKYVYKIYIHMYSIVKYIKKEKRRR